MNCPECSEAIPPFQKICPSCYASTDQFAKLQSSERPGKTNLIVLIEDAARRGIYSHRIEAFLQPDYVAWSFSLESGEELEEVTRSEKQAWPLLLTDAETYVEAQAALAKFRERYPGAMVVVVSSESQIVSAAEDTSVTMLRHPPDEGGWLRMMHELLGTVRA